MLDDGRYDAFIVWADDDVGAEVDDAQHEHALRLTLTIIAGAYKGDVLDVVARNLATRDPIDLVGLPCTLVVEDGRPRVEP